MITGSTYRYFLILITVFAVYQLIFFYLIKPYYHKKIFDTTSNNEDIPEVAFEVVYLLLLILGLAVAPIIEISPYLLWGVILLIYGISIKRSRQSFFLASALLFKPHRKLDLKKQLKQQNNAIVAICFISGIVFTVANYFL